MTGPSRMTVSPAGIRLLHGWEACRLEAYQDIAGIWTVGWGTTRYPDGRRVREGDRCTQEQADAWFRHHLQAVEVDVDALTTDALAPRQFDALVCLAYNIGVPGYQGSTVRRRVNAHPDDPGIREAFMRWCRANQDADPYKERSEGLWNRRHAEADHYFGVQTPVPAFPGP